MFLPLIFPRKTLSTNDYNLANYHDYLFVLIKFNTSFSQLLCKSINFLDKLSIDRIQTLNFDEVHHLSELKVFHLELQRLCLFFTSTNSLLQLTFNIAKLLFLYNFSLLLSKISITICTLLSLSRSIFVFASLLSLSLSSSCLLFKLSTSCTS